MKWSYSRSLLEDSADILAVWGHPRDFGESLEKSKSSLSLYTTFYVYV